MEGDFMKIAVDAMGGDYAPRAVVEGAILAAREHRIKIVLVGDQEILRKILSKYDTRDLFILVQNAPEVVGMNESPLVVLRNKKKSSIRVAFDLVKRKEAVAVVSAGNSGAAMVAAGKTLGKLNGVDRPALAVLIPNQRGVSLVLDVGANVDCKPYQLIQFAIMGSVYAKYILKLDDPRVGLMSNGEESSKGNGVTREANSILEKSSINYIGCIEGGDVFNDEVDVVVCDGFVGNVILKVSEGLADFLAGVLEKEIKKYFLSKVGYLLSKRSFNGLKKMIDYSEYGGAPLLGIDGVGIVCHGKSSPKAIMNAIYLAHEYVKKEVKKHMLEELDKNRELERLKSKYLGIWRRVVRSGFSGARDN
jgi:glycerol-3-phosphate acyltransferase PlsX